MPRFVVFDHHGFDEVPRKCAVDADQVTAVVPYGIDSDTTTLIYWAGAQVAVKGSFDEVFAQLLKWNNVNVIL